MKSIFQSPAGIFIYTLLFSGVLMGSSSCTRGVPADPTILAALKTVARNCRINPGNAYLTECRDGAAEKLNGALKARGPDIQLASLTSALKHRDVKTRSVAARTLFRRFRYARALEPFRRKPGSIPVNAVEDLIHAVKHPTAGGTDFILPAAVHLAMLRGYHANLFDMLDTHPSPRVREKAFALIMTYGRMGGFFKIKLLVSRPPLSLARAAASAPLNMYHYSPQEVRGVCPWALGLLGHTDAFIASRGGAILAVRCGGTYIDLFLREANRRAKAGKLRPPFSLALTEFPLTCESVFKESESATKAQCREAKRLIRLIRR